MSRVGVVSRFRHVRTGGELYVREVTKSLTPHFETREVTPAGTHRVTQWWNCRNLGVECDIWIEDFVSLAALHRQRTGKIVVLVHHLARNNLRDQTFGRLLEFMFFRALPSADHLVVVSRYWKKFFEERSEIPISVIYNGFHLEDYTLPEFDEAAFRRSMGLDERPIVFLGLGRPGKGVEAVANALEGGDEWQLVTTGQGDATPGVNNLKCSFEDYLRLVSVSAATVQMPTYPEGWNRVAHESLLLGTPVVANGSGGMRELLEGAGQPICPTVGALRERVRDVLRSESRVSESGLRFVRGFSAERFASEWKNLIDRLSE